MKQSARAGRPWYNAVIMSKHAIILVILVCGLCICADRPAAPAGYSNDFEQAKPGAPPADLMVLNGAFTVVRVDGNNCLELAPDPLDGDGLLFGPTGAATGTVSARIWAAATGRRFPEFGIGANDAGGYKLIVVPAQGTIELRKGDDAKASAHFAWKSGTWTHLALRVEKLPDGKYAIRGKAWVEGSPEPKEWMVSTKEDQPPAAGRASIWGMPYSGKPIRFDDLKWE